MILSLMLTTVGGLVGFLLGVTRRTTVDKQVITCLHSALVYEQKRRAAAEEQLDVVTGCPPIARKQARIIDVTRN